MYRNGTRDRYSDQFPHHNPLIMRRDVDLTLLLAIGLLYKPPI
jgi:hypothetical protein